MTNWELFLKILESSSLRWRKILIFGLFFGFIYGFYAIWQAQRSTEAVFDFAQLQPSGDFGWQGLLQYNLQIEIKSNGKVLINGKDASKNLQTYPDYYELRILALDNPGQTISHFQAEVILPKDFQEKQIYQDIIAVHGVGSNDKYFVPPRTLIFLADDIAPQATLTIVARLPKDSLTLPLGKKLIYILTNFPVREYLIIAGVLPILTLLIMFIMILKRRKDQIVRFLTRPMERPPEDIPPAVVGVLIDGQVGPREIAATLIDLAYRGYVYITCKGQNFSFGQRKNMNLEKLPELRSYERTLLSKIFQPGGYRSTREDVEIRVAHHIFSRKIAQVYLEMYNEATEVGYFISNPGFVHRRWKFTGITLFFIGILGFVHGALFAPDPKYSLFFWVGEIAAASVIVKLSGLMPIRSPKGSSAFSKWMAFRSYLKLNRPIAPGKGYMDEYMKYLPFAIVLGVEADWAKRFLKEPFSKPEWYESTEPVVTLENFITELYPIINFTGSILAKSHDPSVD